MHCDYCKEKCVNTVEALPGFFVCYYCFHFAIKEFMQKRSRWRVEIEEIYNGKSL